MLDIINCTGKDFKEEHLEQAEELGFSVEPESRLRDLQGDSLDIRMEIESICSKVSDGSNVAVPWTSSFVSDLFHIYLLTKGCKVYYPIFSRDKILYGFVESYVSESFGNIAGAIIIKDYKGDIDIAAYSWGLPRPSLRSGKDIAEFCMTAADSVEESIKRHYRGFIENREEIEELLEDKIQDGIIVDTVIRNKVDAGKLFTMVDIARDKKWYGKITKKSLNKDSISILIISPDVNFEKFCQVLDEKFNTKVVQIGLNKWEIQSSDPGAWIGHYGAGISKLKAMLGKDIRVKTNKENTYE